LVGPRTIRAQIDFGLDIESGEFHVVDAEHTHSDVSKAQKLLGSEPSITIPEGVGPFIERYREDRGWDEPLAVER
jgi:UDP-glucose 4-epimerase